MSPTKKFTFSFIALVIIPALFFLLLEGVLRLAGLGNNYDYFHEITINGEKHFQDNKAFANQFYPPSLGVAPLNNTIAANKSDEVIRVYVLGGSAAQGFPHVNHGLDRHLTAHLKAALPHKKIEVINTAMTSVNSHVVYEVARTLPENTADYAVILMGNNEVVGPYGPSTFSQNFLSSLPMIRTLQALKRTYTWQTISMVAQSFRSKGGQKELEWEGMQMFSEFSVPFDDDRLTDVYSHYENNLKDMIEILQDKGMHVILSSVPVNLRHSAPFGSSHNKNLTEAELTRWNELNRQAKKLLDEQDWEMAKLAYQDLLKLDETYADSHFHLATILEELNDYKSAKEHFKLALHYDTKRFRTNHVINEIIESVANSLVSSPFSYVNSVEAFDNASHPYAPGWDLLHEHVHFDYMGNYLLAREFTHAIMSDLSLTEGYKPLPKGEAKALIGFPNHETNQVMNRLLSMVKKPPFTQQSNSKALVVHTENRTSQISSEVGNPADVVKRRQPLVEQNLADWKIHYELAELNRFLRNKEAAFFHLKKLVELYPHNHESYIKLGEHLISKGEWSKANRYLEQSLHYVRGNETKTIQAYGMIGLNYMKSNQFEKGKEYLENIVNDFPDQISANIRAYGALIKYAKQTGNNKDFYRYINDVKRYANLLIKNERVDEFPLLYRRMAQIMTIAGESSEAQRWQSMQTQAQN